MSLLRHRPLLSSATSNDDKPTPGYQYLEISKITHNSLDSCRALEDYLLKRLAKDSPYIKAKVLRIIKHVCERGHVEFRRDLQRKNEAIKACLQFKGKNDPLKGDRPNQEVRDSAKEAMVAIFESEETSAQVKGMEGFGSGGPGGEGSSTYSARAQAYANSSTGSGGGGGSRARPGDINAPIVSSGTMVGIGNPLYQSKQNQKQGVMSRMKSKVQNYAAKKTAQSNQSSRPPDGSYGAPSAGPGYAGPSYTHASSSYNNRGLNSSDRESSYNNAFQHQGFAPSRRGGDERDIPTGEQNNSVEERVIGDFTAPGGMRAAPSRADLQGFCNRVSTLDLDVVADILLGRLSAKQYQVRLKALYAIEAMILHRTLAAAPLFADQSGPIQEQVGSVQPSVRDKANKILLKLFPDGNIPAPVAPAPVAAAPAPPAAPAAAPQEALFSVDDEPAAAPVAAAPVAAPAPAAPVDMFGGMSVRDNAAQPAAQPAPSLIEAEPAPAAAPVTAPPAQASGFDFMSGGAAAAPAPAAAPAAAAPAAGAPSGFDFMGPSTTAPPPAAAPAPVDPTALFDPMANGEYQPRRRSSSAAAQQMLAQQQAMMMQMQTGMMMQPGMMPMMQPNMMMQPGMMPMMQPGMMPMMQPGMMMPPQGVPGGTIGSVPPAKGSNEEGFGFIADKQADQFDFVSDHMKGQK